MPDNDAHNAGQEPREMTPREAVMEALRAAAEEQARAQAVKDFLYEGLESLRRKSGGKFYFAEGLVASGYIMLRTNIEMETATSPTWLAIALNEQYDVFTNAPDADSPPAASFEPSQKEIDDANAYVEQQAAQTIGDLSPAQRQKIYNDYLKQLREAAVRNQQTNNSLTPTTAAAALAAIAKEAALHSYIACMPDDAGVNITEAEKAVLDGLRGGIRQREDEIMLVDGAAKPFTEGLKLLEKLSDGGIEVTSQMCTGRSAIEIKIMAPTLDEYSEPFKTQFLKVDIGGQVSFGDNNANYPQEKYEALNEEHIDALLTEIAKSAFFAGKIRSMPAKLAGDASAEQKTVLKALHTAEGEREMAHIAADSLIEGLNTLKSEFYGQFNFDVVELKDKADVAIILNPGKSSVAQITTDKNGIIRMGDNSYDGLDSLAVNKALTKITQDFMAERPRLNSTALRPRPQP